jgi:glycosyltransferase involved in cell wall biosynthesis
MATAQPHLSVLVPAYELAGGVTRILDAVASDPLADIECIISDDSRTDAVAHVVREHAATRQGRVRYLRNDPPLGAIPNWNHLLEMAAGRFVLVLHHDEWPRQPQFFSRLCASLNDDVDALVLDCLVAEERTGRVRRHFPVALRALLLRLWPAYLLRRNFLGAPSVLAVRRDRVLPFDTRIHWKVDVEWFTRLFRQPGFRVETSRTLEIVSLAHPGSITATLGRRVSELDREDSRLLRSENPELRILALGAPRTPAERLAALAETSFWLSLRGVTRLADYYRAFRVPRSDAGER